MGRIESPQPNISYVEQFARAYGRHKAESSKEGKVYPSDSPEYFQSFVNAWYRYRQSFESEWAFIDREYNIGRDVRETSRFLQPWGGEGDDSPEILPARIYSLVHIIESEILGNRAKFFLQGFDANTDHGVRKALEEALNNEWTRTFSLYREARLVVRDCARKGFGVMLTGFEEDFDPEEQREQAIRRREQRASNPLVGAGAPAGQYGNYGLGDPAEEGFEGDSRVRRGRVVTRRVSPWQFLFDPDARDHETARINGRLIIADYETVRNDKLLQNTEKLEPMTRSELLKKIGKDHEMSDFGLAQDGDALPYHSVCFYELFHRRPGGKWDMAVVPPDGSYFLRYVEDAYWIGNPYKTLQWNDDGEGFIPMSDTQSVLSPVLAERALLTKMFEGYARENVDVTFASEELGLNEDDIDNMINGYVSDIKLCKHPEDGNKPLSSYFHKLQKDPKSPDALNVLAALQRVIEVSSGASPNTFGQALKSGTTATEAAEVASRTRGRGSHKLAAMEEFLSSVAYDRLGMMAQHYEPDDIFRIAGEEAAAAWEEAAFTEEQVRDYLRVHVDPGSTQPKNEAQRTAVLGQLLQMGLQTPIGQQMINLPQVLEDYVESLGEKDGSKYLNMDAEGVQALAEQLQAQAASTPSQGAGTGVASPPSEAIAG